MVGGEVRIRVPVRLACLVFVLMQTNTTTADEHSIDSHSEEVSAPDAGRVLESTATNETATSGWGTMGLVALVAALIALVSAVAACWTARAAWKHFHLAREEAKAARALAYCAKFHSREMIEIRKKAATCLLHRTQEVGSKSDVDQVLNFFDLIGILQEKSLLDFEIIQHQIGAWVSGYWLVTEEHRKDDNRPCSWSDAERLCKRVKNHLQIPIKDVSRDYFLASEYTGDLRCTASAFARELQINGLFSM